MPRLLMLLSLLTSVSTTTCLVTPTLAADASRPNVVMILADDQGWGDLSIHGNQNIATPNIDQLAKDGARFDWFYVCHLCAPTRAEMLTGRFYGRTGVRGVSTGQERLNLDEKTIAQYFKEAGYATGAFGKWHNGMQFPYHPNARGFDEYYGFCSGHWGHYFSPELDHNNTLVRCEGYITDDLTNHAIEFIAANQDKPFFCYVPYCTPHSPMQVPDQYYDKFANMDPSMKNRDPEKEQVGMTRAALAMCENVDWNVGRILKTLDDLDLAKNTIVIYFSDNGPNSWRWNGDMKGRKGSIDEGGTRVPCFIRYPGTIKPETQISEIAGAVDFLPTLLDFAGIETTYPQPIDGRSLKPLLTGKEVAWPDRALIASRNHQISVRNQAYRLDNDGKLYNILEDIGQRHDVSQQHPDVAQELKQIAQQYRTEMLPKDDHRPFTVGYSASTPLPARDGVAHGEIKRSAPAPNCSYFTDWKTTEGTITWDVEVGEPGTYEAIVYYTCPTENVGVEIQAELLGQKTAATINQAHDPAAYGPERDRFHRGAESPVKDFKPFSLGTLELPQGHGTLTLSAPKIPGGGAIEVRYVWLNRQ
ncbi:N-acetylgalactosamine 6-sulfate sulfatase [Bremerella cremea]|uniref:N-acetylgalactosamine 6-sulfate sulfatase n=1 Tax=Bremerella cremea TaxID=1031537 RepID=A0A368KWG4_9BACT|nr:arylsulfatase [Bremerella cremea]RCS54768.1 N-acetylgalactosamine 6-sulfate sulfatase [Bremerella cremea]